MNRTLIDPRTRNQLEEAIREIHLMAGLDVSGQEGHNVRQAERSVAVGVTSPDYGDGKTTIAIALASSLSHDFGSEVTLVDADLHTHSVERQYGLQGQRGLAEVLMGKSGLADVTHPVDQASMRIVPAGASSGDPARMARSERLSGVMQQLKSQNSHVVLDLPSALHSMNTPALAQRCDGVIVVVRHGRTTRQQLDRTLHLLKDANVVGVVVNREKTSIPTWVQKVLALRQ